MDRCTQLIMPHNLCFRILMFENRQQIKQREALRLCPRICRATILIQSAFITYPDAVPVETSHVRAHFRYRAAMMHLPVPGDIKMIADILEAPLQMTLPKLLYGEGNIAARRAAMNHQQFNLAWEIMLF